MVTANKKSLKSKANLKHKWRWNMSRSLINFVLHACLLQFWNDWQISSLRPSWKTDSCQQPPPPSREFPVKTFWECIITFWNIPLPRHSVLLNRNRLSEWNWMWNILLSSPEMSIWSSYNHQSSKQPWKGNHTSLQCQLIQTSQVHNIQARSVNPKTLEVFFFAMYKQRCQTKAIKNKGIAKLSFLTLKKLFQV